MELFMGEKSLKLEGNQLAQLKAIINFVIDLSYKSLNDVTEKEYYDKCNQYGKIENTPY